MCVVSISKMIVDWGHIYLFQVQWTTLQFIFLTTWIVSFVSTDFSNIPKLCLIFYAWGNGYWTNQSCPHNLLFEHCPYNCFKIDYFRLKRNSQLLSSNSNVSSIIDINFWHGLVDSLVCLSFLKGLTKA